MLICWEFRHGKCFLARDVIEQEECMPFPIGHTAIGLATLYTFHKPEANETKTAQLLYAAALSNLPDIDVLLGLLLHNNGAAFHRGPTHSLLFALLTAVLAWQAGRVWKGIPRFGFTVCFLLVFSHVLADMLLTASPVSLLWPMEVHWSPGNNSWGAVIHAVLFKSIQDAGIAAVAFAYLIVLRYLRNGKQGIVNALCAMTRCFSFLPQGAEARRKSF